MPRQRLRTNDRAEPQLRKWPPSLCTRLIRKPRQTEAWGGRDPLRGQSRRSQQSSLKPTEEEIQGPREGVGGRQGLRMGLGRWGGSCSGQLPAKCENPFRGSGEATPAPAAVQSSRGHRGSARLAPLQELGTPGPVGLYHRVGEGAVEGSPGPADTGRGLVLLEAVPQDFLQRPSLPASCLGRW